MPNPVKQRVQTKGHFIRNRQWEIVIGLAITIVGMVLLWDAYDGHNKKMPWPMSGMAPW
jgi:hypothetical protein